MVFRALAALLVLVYVEVYLKVSSLLFSDNRYVRLGVRGDNT